MEIQLAVAASPKQVRVFMEKLESRGFSFEPSKPDSDAIKAYKVYVDPMTGEFKARLNMMAYGFNEGAFFEYSMYVETYARDAVTGEKAGVGNSFDLVTQNNDRFTHALLFLDSVMCGPACIGESPIILNGD
jgi:hypothetical protein